MIAIIDADHILYTFLHGIKKLDENGEPIKADGKFVYDPKPFEQACSETDDYIKNILLKIQATGYVGFLGGSSKSRKEINESYKANRKDLPKPENFGALKAYLVDKWKFILVDSAEVDDYVRSFYRNNIDKTDCCMVSPDKDILFLEGHHFNPKKSEWVTTSKDVAYYYFWSSMLIGDSADNVKGVEGVGPKTAMKILDGKEDYHTVVFDAYCTNYGVERGIQEFYKNYNCLLIKNNIIFNCEINKFEEEI